MQTVNVRYIVHDVDEAIAFYCDHLGFALERHPARGFAMLHHGGLGLLLNAPGAGGAGSARIDGSGPRPGGWNRFQRPVADLDDVVAQLQDAGVAVPSGIVSGTGGRQALVADPAGNLVELFERSAR